jgi:6-phosphogluconolactonase (cycloisomerase 2 family)
VTTGSDTCSSSNGNSSGVFYVLNQGTKQIATYSIASGKLKQIGTSYTLSAAPYSIAIAPNGKFLYVGTATGIFLFNIATGGGITLANNSNVISQDIASTMQVDSTGQWLLEAGPNLAELLAIHINTSTGVPTSNVEQYTILPAATINQLAISQDNTHVFVAMGAAGTEEVIFAAGNGSPFGTLANIKVKNSAGAALSVAVDPQNELFYVGETAAVSGSNTGGIRVFNYNTLVEAANSPLESGGLAPYAIMPTRVGSNAGNDVYVANRTVSGSSTGNIAAFYVSTSGSTSTLTPLGSPVTAGANPISMAQDSTGNYLLVVNFGGNPDLQGYTFSSGTLTSALTSATGSGTQQAIAIAAAP